MPRNTMKKVTAGIITVIILCFCLCATSFALVYEILEVRDNYFHTGNVSINLNDGEPVIREDEFIFEPGMTVFKPFFIENMSSWEVYYRLYFEDVGGALADVLEIRVQDGDKVLYSGTAREFTQVNVGAADDVLAVGERRDLMIYFHFPEKKRGMKTRLARSFSRSARKRCRQRTIPKNCLTEPINSCQLSAGSKKQVVRRKQAVNKRSCCRQNDCLCNSPVSSHGTLEKGRFF